LLSQAGKQINEIKEAKGINKFSKLEDLITWVEKKIDAIGDVFEALLDFNIAGVKAAFARLFGLDDTKKTVVDAAKNIEEKAKEKAAEVKPMTADQLKVYEQQFSEHLEKKFGLEMTPEKKAKLKEILKTRAHDMQIAAKDAYENKTLLIGDVLFKSVTSSVGFLYDLVDAGIIPVSHIFVNFVDSGVRTIQLSLGALGLGTDISLGEFSMDAFGQEISKLSSAQKGLLLGLIYRQGGLAIQMFGNITYHVASLLTLPFDSPEYVSSFKVFWE